MDKSKGIPVSKGRQNRLAKEKSPYLLQHADNPVDWFPWGSEAFQKAEKENRLIFLSIGYSTCHWCHVMEEESFSDNEVAAVLNADYVSIKVDREERPDIDAAYMRVCQLMNHSCGWPLNVILTPDRKPFLATTYIPKHGVEGRPGMLEILPRLARLWETQPEKIHDAATEIMKVMQSSVHRISESKLDAKVLEQGLQQLMGQYDPNNGGFGSAPKFPSPHNLLFLIRQSYRLADPKPLNQALTTLRAMRRGGIYDHVGYGFFRYSTDERWMIPHFEKMLYDQAMELYVYSEAFRRTSDPLFSQTAEEIFTFLEQEMSSPEGAFLSAIDADSPEGEGRYYVWTLKQLETLLKKEELHLVQTMFQITTHGNFRDPHGDTLGMNHLALGSDFSWKELARKLGQDENKLRALWNRSRIKMLKARQQRPAPLKDDKVLTDWNGLAIGALAYMGSVMSNEAAIHRAEKAVKFIQTHLWKKDGSLLHRYREGSAAIPGFLGDYTTLGWGFLELFFATQNPHFLEGAIQLSQSALDKFYDEASGRLYMTESHDEVLPVRPDDSYDGAIPSATSMFVWNLVRLYRVTGQQKWQKAAEQIESSVRSILLQYPSGFTFLLSALDFQLGPSHEVVIAGPAEHPLTQALLKELREGYHPFAVYILKEKDDSPVTRLAEYAGSYKTLEHKPTAYVCEKFLCYEPTHDIERMKEYLTRVAKKP